MQLCYVCSLLQLATITHLAAMRNVAYNAVCLFDKVVECLDSKLKGLDWRRIVLCKHLVEGGRDVHCVEVQATCSYEMTMLPAGMPCWSFFRFSANDVQPLSTGNMARLQAAFFSSQPIFRLDPTHLALSSRPCLIYVTSHTPTPNNASSPLAACVVYSLFRIPAFPHS